MVMTRPAGLLAIILFLAGGAAQAESPCHPAIDPGQPQYIVGYGSLMDSASKRRTAPTTGPNLPAMVHGYQRAWNLRNQAIGFGTTFLGLRPDPDADLAAAVYRLFDPAEIAATDRREAGYCRETVAPEAIRMLDGSGAAPVGQIWIYVTQPESVQPPDAAFPIVQSYVDLFIGGCLDLEARVIGANRPFAESCVATTEGWSQHWVNDRIHPRRPFANEPRAGRIDRLLHKMVPDQFASIRIE